MHDASKGSPAAPDGCLSDLVLDRVIAGAAPSAPASAHLAKCTECQARLASFRTSQEMCSPAIEQLLARATSKARPTKESKPWFSLPRLTLAASMAGLLVVAFTASRMQSDDQASSEVATDTIRPKGTSLGFYVHRDGIVAPGVSGGAFKAGDALRFAITTSEPTHFYLVGIEDSGAVSAYYPFGGASSAFVEPGVDAPLPDSLVLDESRTTEYFVGIFRDTPITMAEVEGAVRRASIPGRMPAFAIEQFGISGNHHAITIRRQEND